jgi:hypothetical protein
MDVTNSETKNICDLQETTNVCKITSCINTIKGIPSNSASPTDIWIITFNDGVKYENKDIKMAILKIFADPNSASLYTSIDKQKLNDVKGLNYELHIYKDVIADIIDYKICSNFVKYLSSGINCSYQDLLSLLKDHLKNYDKNLTLAECKNSLNRNIEYLYMYKRSNRPSIQDIDYIRYNPPNRNLRYNMIMNETSNGIKFSDWLEEYKIVSNFETELWNILLQIAVACYSMALSKMVHNDLHSGNIFIEKYDSDKTVTYYVNNFPIVIKTRFKALIYDFDRAYCKSLGDNPILIPFYCTEASQCNRFIENKDIVKILCYVVSSINNTRVKLQLLKLLTKDQNNINEIYKTYNTAGCFLQESRYGKLVSKPDSFYMKLNNNEQVINTLKTYLVNHLPDDNLEFTYFCNKDFFEPNGSLKKNTIKKFYDELKKKRDSKRERESERIAERDILRIENMRLDLERAEAERQRKMLERKILESEEIRRIEQERMNKKIQENKEQEAKRAEEARRVEQERMNKKIQEMQRLREMKEQEAKRITQLKEQEELVNKQIKEIEKQRQLREQAERVNKEIEEIEKQRQLREQAELEIDSMNTDDIESMDIEYPESDDSMDIDSSYSL